MTPKTATTRRIPSTVSPALDRGLRRRLALLDLSALSLASSSSRSLRLDLSYRVRIPPRLQVLLQHPGRREVVHAPATLLRATSLRVGDSNSGGETLVPRHEAHARQLSPQGVQSSQNLARLKPDLALERLRHANDDLGDALFVHEPPERSQQVFARHHLERRSEEHTSELQSRQYLVCRLLLE